MDSRELARWTLADAAAAIRTRTVSPVDLTRAMLDRIERLNPRTNAYITVCAERALADAERAASEISAGWYGGPLHGVPVALKDLFATAGIRTTAGAKILADWVPETDSTAARRLREAGSVLLGKLNTHEFAYGVTTNNPHFGATRNPWNRDCIPGGSSGGSGAAAAAGLAFATLGTDTGGSIRIPASLCGVVGLKPTYGRVSKAGVVPLSLLFDHAGPITRTVEDAAIVLDAIAGYDPADAASVRIPVDGIQKELRRGVRGLRVGVPRRYFFDRLDGEVGEAVEKALRVFYDLGAEVEDVDVPGVEAAMIPFLGLMLAEAKEIHAENLRTRPHDFGADLRAILALEAPNAGEMLGSLRTVMQLTEAARRVLETSDVLLTATTPVTAPRIGQETVLLGGSEQRVDLTLVRCTAPFNATHLPALSVPCGFDRLGLPIGLQIVGKPFDEAMVLRVGHAYEQATEWHRRRPPE